MTTIEKIMAARRKLAEARSELRQLASECQNHYELHHVLMGGFTGEVGKAPDSVVTNGQMWFAVGLNPVEARGHIDRVSRVRANVNFWEGPEYLELCELEKPVRAVAARDGRSVRARRRSRRLTTEPRPRSASRWARPPTPRGR